MRIKTNKSVVQFFCDARLKLSRLRFLGDLSIIENKYYSVIVHEHKTQFMHSLFDDYCFYSSFTSSNEHCSCERRNDFTLK